MTRGVANDVGYMVMLEKQAPASAPNATASARPRRAFVGYPAEFTPGQKLARSVSAPQTVLDRQLAYIFSSQNARKPSISTPAASHRLRGFARAAEGWRAAASGPARTRHRVQRRHFSSSG